MMDSPLSFCKRGFFFDLTVLVRLLQRLICHQVFRVDQNRRLDLDFTDSIEYLVSPLKYLKGRQCSTGRG